MQSHSADAPQSVSTSTAGEPASGQPGALDPRRPIEVLSSGTGTTNDPSGTDTQQPPGAALPGAID